MKAFAPSLPAFGVRSGALKATIAEGVEFDTVAREWRCKWSADNDKASLVEAQKALESVLDEVKGVPGVKRVDRVVCGGCLDFKVSSAKKFIARLIVSQSFNHRLLTLQIVTSLEADKFGDWEGKEFAPESSFVDKLKAIDGISQVETQTYTLMPL